MNYGRRFMTLKSIQGSRPSPWERNARKQKRQLVEKWEEIFANHIFDKEPLSRIYKELKKKKKTNA